MGFLTRAAALPHLGLGVSTEFGAKDAPGALDIARLAHEHPAYACFLEVGVEAAKGIDDDVRAWLASGRPCTYHFLDVNLDEPSSIDEAWLSQVRGWVDAMRPAWLCGDAGLWHAGPRDRGHMLLLPPVMVEEAVAPLAAGISRLREACGLEVLPENPPGTAFVGDLHLLEFFARVCLAADTGMLLDVAHLAMYQRVMGHAPLFGLDAFPCERIVEVHVAGGAPRNTEGFAWVEDTHGGDVLEDTWQIWEYVVARAPQLRAVVFECERNDNENVLQGFSRLASRWPA